MELEINNIPSKSKNVTEKDREIINRALFSYQIVLGQYEKYTDEVNNPSPKVRGLCKER